MIEDKLGQEVLSRRTLRPFNIDARLNGAYVALGLLWKGLWTNIGVTTRAGQDSDYNLECGGSSGNSFEICLHSDFYKSGIPTIADTKFDFTQSSFNDITKATLENKENRCESRRHSDGRRE